jgi:hypothetical protein
MISLSNTIKQIIQLDRVKYFFLVSIDNNKNYTSNSFDITMSNGITYFSDGGLSGVEPPSFSSVVDRSSYSIMFNDVNNELKSFFEQGATGKKLIIRLGFFNTLDSPVNNININEVLTSINDTILIYQGVIDGQTYNLNFNNGSINAKIEGSSPMADLDLVRPFYSNKDFMKQRNINDTSFDAVFDNSSSKLRLKWGKT